MSDQTSVVAQGWRVPPPTWQPAAMSTGPTIELPEFRNADFLWDSFHALMGKPSWARDNLSEELHRERCGFIRQAESYWSGAQKVDGTAGALLYYYCFMNLAKAELLPLRPNEMVADPMHGLRCRPSAQENFATAELKVDSLSRVPNQIFYFLYEKRTGEAWPASIDGVNVVEALCRIPELVYETQKLGYTSSVCHVYHTITLTETHEARSEIAAVNYEAIRRSASTAKAIGNHYSETLPFPNWRDIFALSPRGHGGHIAWLSAKDSVNIDLGGNYMRGDLGWPDWLARLQVDLGACVEPPQTSSVDGYILPSISTTAIHALTTDLARYAIYYYVSSLVRYRPSTLDFSLKPDQAWLLSAFTRQSALPLLQGFFNQISKEGVIFAESRA
jgi:hypothetical protein